MVTLKFQVVLTIIIFSFLNVNAQNSKIITGKVTTFGIIPLNNVQFIASKSGEVAYSDSLGLFSISCSEKDVIKIFASGFDGKRIKAKKYNHVSIDLVYSNNETSFAEATEKAHISKKRLELSIKKYPLKGEKNYARYTNIYELIKNEIHNVKVNGRSVTPMIPTSFGASQEVLYVVDGIIVSDISTVIPQNVKSIKYVDGPAASRYGVRGANGAIEIIMK